MDSIEIFRKKLKAITDKKNPRQSTIADSVGFSRSEMNDFLRGRKDFSLNRMEDIAKFLGTTFIDFVSEPANDVNCGQNDDPPATINNVIHLQHAEIIKQFKNAPRARDANLSLLNIERMAPDVFDKLVAHIQSVEWGLKMVDKKDTPKKIQSGGERQK